MPAPSWWTGPPQTVSQNKSSLHLKTKSIHEQKLFFSSRSVNMSFFIYMRLYLCVYMGTCLCESTCTWGGGLVTDTCVHVQVRGQPQMSLPNCCITRFMRQDTTLEILNYICSFHYLPTSTGHCTPRAAVYQHWTSRIKQTWVYLSERSTFSF